MQSRHSLAGPDTTLRDSETGSGVAQRNCWFRDSRNGIAAVRPRQRTFKATSFQRSKRLRDNGLFGQVEVLLLPPFTVWIGRPFYRSNSGADIPALPGQVTDCLAPFCREGLLGSFNFEAEPEAFASFTHL